MESDLDQVQTEIDPVSDLSIFKIPIPARPVIAEHS